MVENNDKNINIPNDLIEKIIFKEGENVTPQSVLNYLSVTNEINKKLIDVTIEQNLSNNNIITNIALLKLEIDNLVDFFNKFKQQNSIENTEVLTQFENILSNIHGISNKLSNINFSEHNKCLFDIAEKVSNIYTDISSRDGYLWKMNNKLNYLWVPVIGYFATGLGFLLFNLFSK